MTNEERDIISQFIARVGGAQASSGFSAGSVPAQQPALPPVDRDADQFIAQQFNQYPEARYRITQLAFVQEHALVEAQNRIKRLEWEVQQAQQAVQQAQQQGQQRGGAAGGGGFFSGLFGGGGNRQQAGGPPPGGPGPWGQPGGQGGPQQGYYQPSAPPPPQYPPNYQQGVFQRQGSGFLGSALTTAAGVAGGMVAGNALMSLFSPHHDSFGGGGFGGGSPWATPSQDAAPAGNQDYVDNGGWDQNSGSNWDQGSGGGTDPSWTDNSGGGWDQGGGGGGSDWDSGGGGSDDTF
jgi:uncharacterized protein